MLTYDEALAHVLERAKPLDARCTVLAESIGSSLSKDIVSPCDLPLFDNSQMDGYAVDSSTVAAATLQHPVWLDVQGVSSAGNPYTVDLVGYGAVKIFTGAKMPPGADSVVPIEEILTERDSDRIGIISSVSPGEFVRKKGEDLTAGTLLLRKGAELGAGPLTALASVGIDRISTIRSPRVLVLSVGDELVASGESRDSLGPGEIFEANSIMLQALLRQTGIVEIKIRIARDTISHIDEVLDEFFGLNRVQEFAPDVVISTGGVSVGDYDLVKQVFARRGEIEFWRAAIRPGKPFAFGHIGEALFFGLPGNPASAFVTYELFVRPALRKMKGLDGLLRRTVAAELLASTKHGLGRRSFQRAVTRYNGNGYVTSPLIGQGSHMISTLSEANSLLILPEDQESFDSGSSVRVMLLNGC